MSEQNQISKPAITKEQWQQIEDELSGSFISVKFNYKGHEIGVTRERKNESTTLLVVYIDGEIKGKWFTRPEDSPKVLPEVWCKRSSARYQPKFIADIEKIYGKRRAKKEYPDLHSRREWFEPFFSKSSVLCRQFKKLKGLELTDAYFLKTKQANVA
ncbi:hypothetical protein PQI64_12745 [Shewanella bicestrii]